MECATGDATRAENQPDSGRSLRHADQSLTPAAQRAPGTVRLVVDSISKTRVEVDVAAAIVEDAFGSSVSLAGLAELTEGWFNAAYVMTVSDGRRCVLKVAPPPHVPVLTYEHDIMTTEVAALGLVRERTTAPVPQVLWFDTSCRRLPSALFVMEHCPGELLSALRPTLDVDQQQIVDAQIARLLRQMNAITHPTFGLQSPSAAKFTRWSNAFAQMMNDALADGRAVSVDLPVADERLRAVVRDHIDVLDEVTVPCFVHWDLWDSNIFVDPKTLEVVGLIDFERALWADPLMEGQFFSKRDDAAFLDAYGIPMLSTPNAMLRRLLYDLYLFVIMIVEVSYRHYPTDDIERFGRKQLALTLAKLDI
jgi:aminoglycoside phosphotransferase (APT) family kinase protein